MDPQVEKDRLEQARSPGCGEGPARQRIAVVSLLFNWPSTGGGNMDTVGMVRGLLRAGYEVRHFYGQAAAMDVGNVSGDPGIPTYPLPLEPEDWRREPIEHAFHEAVAGFEPDCVIITDSWTFKPLLAKALCDYPYLLRFHGLEGLCPLNSVRFVMRDGQGYTCHNHILADAVRCLECLRREAQVGTLQAAERALSDVEDGGYTDELREALSAAAGVLVNNLLLEGLLAPYSSRVSVATPGIDAGQLQRAAPPPNGAVKVILFPSLWPEVLKGYHVLEEACARLRGQRRDFEVRVAGFEAGRLNEWTTCVGWYRQDRLAELYGQADIVVVPSICEEAFGIVAAEAMAAGRPVIASRSGGLQFVVRDGTTGLLFEPGNAAELAAKLTQLLDDAGLRDALGQAGRARAQELYSWEQVIERCYEPVLSEVWARPGEPLNGHAAAAGRAQQAASVVVPEAAEPVVAKSPQADKRRRRRRGKRKPAATAVGVSLCMIVRNEEDNLPECLRSVQGIFDEIVIVDTGSQDRTKEIAQSFGARVHDFTWVDDFAAARNESLRHARGQWIMWLDADDRLNAENAEKLASLCANLDPAVGGYIMRVRSLPDPEGGIVVVDHVKLFQNREEVRFEYRVHEQIALSIQRAGGRLARTDIVIEHTGYPSAEARRRKRERNQAIMRGELEERPHDPFLLFNLGYDAFETGEYAPAIEALLACISLYRPVDTLPRKAYSLAAQSYRRLGRLPEAQALCAAALEVYPQDPELLYVAGLIASDKGDLPAAQDHFHQALTAPEGDHFRMIDIGLRGYKTYHALALNYRRMGDCEQAEGYCRRAIAEAPHFLPPWIGLGELLLDSDRLDEAVELVGRLSERHPQAPPTAYLRGRLALAQGELEEAEAAFRQALALDSGLLPAQWRLCQTLVRDGRLEEAEAALVRLVELAPEDPEAHFRLGGIRYELGKYQEAVERLAEAVRLHPTLAAAHRLLGLALGAAGRAGEGVRCLRQAVALEPRSGTRRLELARLCHAAGASVEARAIVERVLAAVPDHEPARELLRQWEAAGANGREQEGGEAEAAG